MLMRREAKAAMKAPTLEDEEEAGAFPGEAVTECLDVPDHAEMLPSVRASLAGGDVRRGGHLEELPAPRQAREFLGVESPVSSAVMQPGRRVGGRARDRRVGDRRAGCRIVLPGLMQCIA